MILDASITVPASDTLDLLLTMVNSLEDLLQFSPEAVTSEDLALLESHQQGSMHGYYFKPTQSTETLTHVLQEQGYRTDLMAAALPSTDPLVAYWLCRKLSHPLPWSVILDQVDEAERLRFPYLFRLKLIAEFLQPYLDDTASLTPEALMQTWLP